MRLVALSLVPMSWAIAGCAVTGGDAGDAETASTTSAVIVVERTTDDATQGPRAEASARFVRIRASASAETALRSVGAGLDLPAAGACAAPSALTGEAAAHPAPVVELLDVGPVSIEANGVATRLLPRQLPDVTDVVSGVVYARAADATVFPATAAYEVHVAGGAALGAVDVAAAAPADPTDVRILNDEGDAGSFVVSGAFVGFEWSDDGSDDEVYVDVRPSGVRCLLQGGGRGSVPTVFFDDAGTLTVHRVHREPLRAHGIDSGEVRFDFARMIAYVRR